MPQARGRGRGTSADGRLAERGFDFMKTELTVHDAQQIHQKLQAQPFVAASVGVTGEEVFPVLSGDEPVTYMRQTD